MLTTMTRDGLGLVHAAAAAAFLLASTPHMGLMAQGLDAEGAIDTIVGSDVTTGQEEAGADEERILAAIDNTSDVAAEVRRKFSLDRVEIIFVPDLDEEGTPIADKLAERDTEIAELRQSIQGSAMFYHAVDSHSVLLNNVVALEFDDDNGVTIFVAGEQPGGGQ